MSWWRKGLWHTVDGHPLIVRVVGPSLVEAALIDSRHRSISDARDLTPVGLIYIDRSAEPGDQVTWSSGLDIIGAISTDLAAKAVAMAVRLLKDHGEEAR